MRLEEQVTSLELSKKLKELGVKQESLFHWVMEDSPYILDDGLIHLTGVIGNFQTSSAFTASELLEILPYEREGLQLSMYKSDDCYEVGYSDDGHRFSWYNNEFKEIYTYKNNSTIQDTLAELLIYLIENKLMENK